MRHLNYMVMVATRTEVEQENLPPTDRITYYHAIRVHLQVAQRKNLDLTCLNPPDQGWTLQKNSVVPVKTDLPAALDWLLQVTRCKCKTTTKHTCNTLICSCRKNGLTFVAACSNCHGEDCENIAILVEKKTHTRGCRWEHFSLV